MQRKADESAFTAQCALRLRVLREHLNLTEAQMAARLGMTLRAYRDYEADRRTRGWNGILKRILDLPDEDRLYSISLDWLFGDSGDDDRPIFRSEIGRNAA